MNKNKYSTNELKYLKQALGHDSMESTSDTFVSNLEKESTKLFGTKFCVAQNSGTSTLHSALLAVGVSNGDEVISPAFSVIMNTAVTLHFTLLFDRLFINLIVFSPFEFVIGIFT